LPEIVFDTFKNWGDMLNNNAGGRHNHVLIAIPVLLQGGTEVQTIALVKALRSAGYSIKVCCYHEHDPVMVSAMQEAEAEVILMNLARSVGRLSLILQLRALFKSLKPAIVHVQYVTPGFLPVIAARLAGIKTVFATVHQPGRTYGWKARLILRWAAHLCSAFFCASKAVEESWFGSSMIFSPSEKRRGRRHFTIYNAIDCEQIKMLVAGIDRAGLRDSLCIGRRPVIGVTGRLRSEKGQSIIIRAMPEIIRAIPDAMLMIVGDGPDRKELESLCDDLGISDHIVWTGQKTHDEAIGLLSVMNLVAVPSLFEGFGLAAAEAMAAGKPVIASNVDGLCEVVDDGETGCLVPPGNSELLAKAIIMLSEGPDMAKRMGQKGYTKVREQFDIKGFSVVINNAYKVFD
jgi:L-malate glycosyltransferase